MSRFNTGTFVIRGARSLNQTPKRQPQTSPGRQHTLALADHFNVLLLRHSEMISHLIKKKIRNYNFYLCNKGISSSSKISSNAAHYEILDHNAASTEKFDFRNLISQIPQNIQIPYYAEPPYKVRDRKLRVKSKGEIDKIRKASQLAAEVLQYAASLINPGNTTTNYIDRKCFEFIVRRGAYPSTLGYHKFPKSICTSINNVVCHGIPDDRIIQDGDIVSIDVTCFLDGYHGDTCITIPVGNVDDAGKDLVGKSREICMNAIKCIGPGISYANIGSKIESDCKKFKLQTVKEFCGHGIGVDFHEYPYVLHYDCSNEVNSSQYQAQIMEPGHVFTIEPMIVDGKAGVGIWDDEWTVATIDGSRCSQFEHTVAITNSGYEILSSL